MISSDLERLVDAIQREKSIPRDVVIEILRLGVFGPIRVQRTTYMLACIAHGFTLHAHNTIWIAGPDIFVLDIEVSRLTYSDP